MATTTKYQRYNKTPAGIERSRRQAEKRKAARLEARLAKAGRQAVEEAEQMRQDIYALELQIQRLDQEQASPGPQTQGRHALGAGEGQSRTMVSRPRASPFFEYAQRNKDKAT